MRIKRIIIIGVVCITVLSTAACAASSGNGTETNSQPTQNTQKQMIEPSQLISKAEAESILGVSLGEGETKEQKAVGLKLCNYESDDQMLQVGLTQQAMMLQGSTSTPESLFRSIVENFSDAAKVEGVGDEAYYATPGMHILKDGYYITISTGLNSSKNDQTELKEAGEIAVANLEKLIHN